MELFISSDFLHIRRSLTRKHRHNVLDHEIQDFILYETSEIVEVQPSFRVVQSNESMISKKITRS